MKLPELKARIEEAYRTMCALPDGDVRFRTPKWCAWPHYVHDMMEAYGWHDARVRMPPPTNEAIDRAEEVLGWFACHLRSYPDGAWALWLTYGKGWSLSQVGRLRGRSKVAIHKRRAAAQEVLLSCLSRERPAWLDRLTLTK